MESPQSIGIGIDIESPIATNVAHGPHGKCFVRVTELCQTEITVICLHLKGGLAVAAQCTANVAATFLLSALVDDS